MLRGCAERSPGAEERGRAPKSAEEHRRAPKSAEERRRAPKSLPARLRGRVGEGFISLVFLILCMNNDCWY